ncbi:MAG: hypothetical protein N3G19_02545 [Candidatus Pacearchaeota archaeon]|nr:hypothetical protein [Candidatus Pacearchaeota archaeon]
MKLKIKAREDKPAVDRYELLVKIEDVVATPSNDYIKKEIAKEMNKSEDVVVVKRISQKFGKREAEALVFVYNSLDSLKKFEPKKKEKKSAAEAPKTNDKAK